MVKRSLIIFSIAFCSSLALSYIVWRAFFRHAEIVIEEQESAYKEADLIIPAQSFLYRGAQSNQLSVVKRLFVNQWIYNNHKDLAKLLVYAQSAKDFAELKTLLYKGIEDEGPKNGAISFVKKSLAIVEADPDFVSHVNDALKKGYTTELQELRALLANASDSKEYKKRATEYRKELDVWMDREHGHLLDMIIAQV